MLWKVMLGLLVFEGYVITNAIVNTSFMLNSYWQIKALVAKTYMEENIFYVRN